LPTTPGGSGATPTIPLTPEARKAYEDLFAKNEIAIEGTTDVGLLQSLDDAQDAVGAVLSADNEYRLNQDTAHFQALQTQINAANDSLTKLKKDIAGISSKISVLGDVAAGIAKVLSLVTGGGVSSG